MWLRKGESIMLIKIQSAATYGIGTVGVSVEVNVASRGFPGFDIVGLPHKSVAESRERVKTAIQNSGIEFPSGKKIIVNLAPADLPKEGSFYDLPIAIGIISLVKNITIPKASLFFGELSLDGGLRHTKGALLLSIFAKESGFSSLYVPRDSANEAAVVPEVNVYALDDLRQLVSHLERSGRREVGNGLVKHESPADSFGSDLYGRGLVVGNSVSGGVDFSEILGQEQAKRALEIAAAGRHNIILIGSPGVGKSMLAGAFTSILPPLDREESLEVTKIYSASGFVPPGGSLIRVRPFRSPHHTVSYAGLIGGGAVPKPGEVSLAHRGVLFLDEFSEFNRAALESMRQPMEAGEITVSRGKGSVTFPSRFTLLAASNPCPCGYLNHTKMRCRCTPAQVEKYRRKLSGPILDRIDLQVGVRSVETGELSFGGEAEKRVLESSEAVRERVWAADRIQKERLKNSGIFSNSEMTNKLIKIFCPLSKDAELLLRRAGERFDLSARSYFKVIKVARTIADLAAVSDVLVGSGTPVSAEDVRAFLKKENIIQVNHVAEALQYRF
jgi:magnesium chelatase family protein